MTDQARLNKPTTKSGGFLHKHIRVLFTNKMPDLGGAACRHNTVYFLRKLPCLLSFFGPFMLQKSNFLLKGAFPV
jgi:hypothetical protein